MKKNKENFDSIEKTVNEVAGEIKEKKDKTNYTYKQVNDYYVRMKSDKYLKKEDLPENARII